MNTTRLPLRSTKLAQVGQLKRGAVWVVALVLTGIVVWQVETRPFVPAAAYAAPVLELMLTGAVPANLSFGLDDLAEVSVTSSSFQFTTQNAPLPFRLAFQGVAEAASDAVYLLSAGTYPLTLTLLEDGGAYRTFTAYEGSVSLSEDGGSVAAFLSDETGRQVFLSARLQRPDAS